MNPLRPYSHTMPPSFRYASDNKRKPEESSEEPQVKRRQNVASGSGLLNAAENRLGNVENDEELIQKYEAALKNPPFCATPDPVAEGTFGRVVKCVRDPNGQSYVVKRQSPDKRAKYKDQMYLTALRENLIHKSLSGHPHVVEHMGSITAEGDRVRKVAILMLNGGKSLDSCRNHPRSLDETGSIGKQILEGLIGIHEDGILHADLKSENIFEDENGLVRIGDFGLAQEIGQPLTQPIVYTRWYRPPEHICNIPLTPKADIWAAGCIFYELVKGSALVPIYDVGSREEHIQADINQLHAIKQRLKLGDFPPAWLQEPFIDQTGAMKSSTLTPWRDFESSISQTRPLLTGNPKFAQFISLLRKMLDPNPDTRISAEQALNHPFFKESSDMGFRVVLNNPIANTRMRISNSEGKEIDISLTPCHPCHHMVKSEKPVTVEIYECEDNIDTASLDKPLIRSICKEQVFLSEGCTLTVDPMQKTILSTGSPKAPVEESPFSYNPLSMEWIGKKIPDEPPSIPWVKEPKEEKYE